MSLFSHRVLQLVDLLDLVLHLFLERVEELVVPLAVNFRARLTVLEHLALCLLLLALLVFSHLLLLLGQDLLTELLKEVVDLRVVHEVGTSALSAGQ